MVNSSSLDDIKSFKVSLDEKEYSKKEILKKYYLFAKEFQNRKLVIEEKFEDLNFLKRVLRTIFFVVGIIVGIVSLKVVSNINIFLIETIGLFVFSIYSFYKILEFQIKKPLIKRRTFLNFIIKINKKFYQKNRYLFENNLMFLYSFLLLQSLMILFSIGLAIGYIIGFSFIHIDFIYESTFNLTPDIENKIIHFFTMPWSFLCSCATPDIVNQKSGNVLVLFVIFTMFFWGILPRFLVYLYGRVVVLPKLGWMYVENFADEKGFFEEIYKKAKIKSNINNQEFKEKKEETYQKFSKQENKYDDRYVLFYRSKSILDIDLSMLKDYKTRCFAYFKQSEDEKYSILNELKGIVYIVIKPNILPDNKFKQYLMNMLKNGNISKIYIILLDGDESGYKLANKNYENYQPWIEEMSKFGDKVDIFLKEN